MKRNQAIKMLRQWHEECIKAAKAIKAPYSVIVKTEERTYPTGTTFYCEARVWDEERNEPVTENREAKLYGWREDEVNIEEYNDLLVAFKADVSKVIEELKKQHAA